LAVLPTPIGQTHPNESIEKTNRRNLLSRFGLAPIEPKMPGGQSNPQRGDRILSPPEVCL
jgi:hypothetical protein